MAITDVVTEVEMELRESQNQRDKRVEGLWKQLDPQGTGELDVKGLQRGLQKIDHPLQNADDMLRQMVRSLDTNRDGKIQYEGRVFPGVDYGSSVFGYKAPLLIIMAAA